MDELRKNESLKNPDARRVSEEELLIGAAAETLDGLLSSMGISQQELALRLGASTSQIRRMLSGNGNLTLRSLSALAWALGVRVKLQAEPLQDRTGTPAINAGPAPCLAEGVGRRTTPFVIARQFSHPARSKSAYNRLQAVLESHECEVGVYNFLLQGVQPVVAVVGDLPATTVLQEIDAVLANGAPVDIPAALLERLLERHRQIAKQSDWMEGHYAEMPRCGLVF